MLISEMLHIAYILDVSCGHKTFPLSDSSHKDRTVRAGTGHVRGKCRLRHGALPPPPNTAQRDFHDAPYNSAHVRVMVHEQNLRDLYWLETHACMAVTS